MLDTAKRLAKRFSKNVGRSRCTRSKPSGVSVISGAGITSEQAKQLDEIGYFIVENALSDAQLASMRSEFERIHALENDRGGHEVHVEPGARRISNIFNKTDAYDCCLEIPEVLGASHYLLGEIKVHGANLRDPVKGYGRSGSACRRP